MYQPLVTATCTGRLPVLPGSQVPAILAKLTAEEINAMQRRVVFVYENFFASLAHNVYTGPGAPSPSSLVWRCAANPSPPAGAAIESTRINLYSGAIAREELYKLLHDGLPHPVPPQHAETPAGVQASSRQCNAPAHRPKEAKDGAVM